MNFKPAVVVVEDVYSSDFYMIAHTFGKLIFCLKFLHAFLALAWVTGLTQIGSKLEDKEPALSRSVPIID